MSRPAGGRYTVAVDFDGVLHSYNSSWVNSHTIPDPPLDGAADWLFEILSSFDVVIFSTRCKSWRGRWAVKRWVRCLIDAPAWTWCSRFTPHAWTHGDVEDAVRNLLDDRMGRMRFSAVKSPALVYIDDRAWRFTGSFPDADQIHRARPWNKPASPPD